MPSPDDLRGAFETLRREELLGVPPMRVGVEHHRRPHLLRWSLAALFLIALVTGGATLLQHRRREEPLRVPVISAPTDFLLVTPDTKLTRSVPYFGAPRKGVL